MYKLEIFKDGYKIKERLYLSVEVWEMIDYKKSMELKGYNIIIWKEVG